MTSLPVRTQHHRTTNATGTATGETKRQSTITVTILQLQVVNRFGAQVHVSASAVLLWIKKVLRLSGLEDLGKEEEEQWPEFT